MPAPRPLGRLSALVLWDCSADAVAHKKRKYNLDTRQPARRQMMLLDEGPDLAAQEDDENFRDCEDGEPRKAF